MGWFELKAWRLFVWWFWRRREGFSAKASGPRVEFVAVQNGVERRLVLRYVDQPDTHSREEVYAMLCAVRDGERRMGWRCPEPMRTPRQGRDGTH